MKSNRKVVLYIAMSLDGYIARKDGDISWLTKYDNTPGLAEGYSEFIQNIDTLIMGNSTYKQISLELFVDKWPYDGLKSYIFTSKPEKSDNSDIEFVNTDLPDFVRQLQGQDGKDIWIVGGNSIVNPLIKNNLIDEYYISIIPTILGDGIALFDKDKSFIQLKLERCMKYDDIITVIYKRD